MEMVPTYLTEIGVHQFIGVLGFLFYIAAFGLVQLGMLDGNAVPFTLLNVIAASLVGISLFAEFNLASALIQGSWIVFGLVGLCLRFRQSRRSRPSRPAHQQSHFEPSEGRDPPCPIQT